MKITQTAFSRIILLTGLLALAGCGQDQNGGSETGSTESAAPSADTGSETAATEEQAATSAAPEPAAETAAAEQPAAADSGGATEETSDSGTAAGGETHTVTARSTSYDPVVLKINPGDTVSWTNMSGHNVHFEAGNIPEGAETWQTALGDNVNRTFDQEGLYLYKCDPHFALGMVGALIVGTPDNVAQVEQNAKGMYKRALAKAMKEIE